MQGKLQEKLLLILEVKDNGIPALMSYRKIVVQVLLYLQFYSFVFNLWLPLQSNKPVNILRLF